VRHTIKKYNSQILPASVNINMYKPTIIFECLWNPLIHLTSSLLRPPPPLQVTDYLCDAPLLLQLLARSLGTVGGLVWLFFFRVAVCCVRTVVSLSSPSLATPPETDPSLCGLLGVLDDLAAVILLLICVINIYQQMAPESDGRSRAAMGSSL